MTLGLVSGVSAAGIGGAVSTPGLASGLLGGATPFGWVSLGASLLGGLGNKVKIEKSGAASQAEGGYGQFMAENKGGINGALIEFDNPVHVAVAAIAVVAVVYAVKKWGK